MKLVDILLDKGKEVVAAAKKPFTIKKIERLFESAIEGPQEQIIDQEMEIHKLRLKLVEDPENAEDILNKIIVAKEKIRKAERTIEIVTSEKETMFEEVEETTETAK